MPRTQNNWLDAEDIQRIAPLALMSGLLGLFGASKIGLFKPLGSIFRGAGRATSAFGRFAFTPQIAIEKYGSAAASAFYSPSRAGLAARAFGRFVLGTSVKTAGATARAIPPLVGDTTRWGAKTATGLFSTSLNLGTRAVRASASMVEMVGRHPVLFGGLAVGGALAIGSGSAMYPEEKKKGLPPNNLGASGDLVFGMNRGRRGGQ